MRAAGESPVVIRVFGELLGGLARVIRAHPYCALYVVAAFAAGMSGIRPVAELFYVTLVLLFLSLVPLGMQLDAAFRRSPGVGAQMRRRELPSVLWPIGMFYAAQHPALMADAETVRPTRRYIAEMWTWVLGWLALSGGWALSSGV